MSPGCLRFDGGDGGDQSPTVTPASPGPTADQGSTPTDAPDPATPTHDRDYSARYPPGLTDEGVEPFLADAHTNALSTRSFRTRWTEANVTIGRAYQQRDYRIQDGAAIGEWSYQGPITIYRSADGGFWREDLGETVTYGEHRSGFDLNHLTWNRRLRRLFLAGSWGPPTVQREQEPVRFGVRASGTDDTAALLPEFEARSIETFEAEATVDEHGVVHSLTAEFQARDRTEDRLFEFRIRYAVGSIGQVEVTEPEWVPRARERAPDVTADIVGESQYVELVVESGNAMLPETHLTLYDQEQGRNAGVRSLAEPMDSGRTYYLYLEDGALRVARGSRPTDASPTQLDSSYGLWAHRAGAEYFMIPRV